MTNPFDSVAQNYDRWYDSPEGGAIYSQEFECVSLVKGRTNTRWLEVGTGTGRFATALDVRYGIDPSLPMLQFSRRGGMRTAQATAEALPFSDASFHGVLMVVALSFCQDPAKAVQESARVLRPGGAFVVGIVPKSTPWGQHYGNKAAAGHPLYSHARFLDISEVVNLATDAGLTLRDTASTLLQSPSEPPDTDRSVLRGTVPGAGFVALRFEK